MEVLWREATHTFLSARLSHPALCRCRPVFWHSIVPVSVLCSIVDLFEGGSQTKPVLQVQYSPGNLMSHLRSSRSTLTCRPPVKLLFRLLSALEERSVHEQEPKPGWRSRLFPRRHVQIFVVLTGMEPTPVDRSCVASSFIIVSS